MDDYPHDSYADLAAEYYDRERHPTCANFRDGSAQIIRRWLPDYWPDDGWVCEIGAGRSLVTEIADELSLNQRNLVLLDSVPEMMNLTTTVSDASLSLVVADALCLPFGENTMELMIASLGDPYNTPTFWYEVARVLVPGGTVLFTTPAIAWSSAFRDDGGAHAYAEFELRDGRKISVPSFIHTEDQQASLMASCGLDVEDVVPVTVDMLDPTQLSPKLNCVGNGAVVTGYPATAR